MRVIAIAALGACAATAPPALPEQTTAAPPPPERKLYVDRTLIVDAPGSSPMREAWVLDIDGERATLVATTHVASGTLATGSPTLARVDRQAVWKMAETHTEKGPVRRVGDHLALDLESPHDSLFLRCWTKTIAVATAGAQLVPRSGSAGGCSDRATWVPATLTHVEALICGQGEGLDDGQANGIDGQRGPLDETLFRFARAPGVELVEVNDGCFEGKGLRLVAPGA